MRQRDDGFHRAVPFQELVDFCFAVRLSGFLAERYDEDTSSAAPRATSRAGYRDERAARYHPRLRLHYGNQLQPAVQRAKRLVHTAAGMAAFPVSLRGNPTSLR